MMKLDRNITNPRRGKYALIKLREADSLTPECVEAGRNHCNLVEVRASAVDFGGTPDTDFFVIRLKDKYAPKALSAYAAAAADDGEFEYAEEVMELARLAVTNPHRRKPD